MIIVRFVQEEGKKIIQNEVTTLEESIWKIASVETHYLVIKTKKNPYITVMQLSIGYYNYYATIPLEI